MSFSAGLLLAALAPATAQLSLTWTKATVDSAFTDRLITGLAFLDATTVAAVGWQPTSASAYSTVLVR